jgi:hypothetical protein
MVHFTLTHGTQRQDLYTDKGPHTDRNTNPDPDPDLDRDSRPNTDSVINSDPDTDLYQDAGPDSDLASLKLNLRFFMVSHSFSLFAASLDARTVCSGFSKARRGP